jgi:hypothetical protein
MANVFSVYFEKVGKGALVRNYKKLHWRISKGKFEKTGFIWLKNIQ